MWRQNFIRTPVNTATCRFNAEDVPMSAIVAIDLDVVPTNVLESPEAS